MQALLGQRKLFQQAFMRKDFFEALQMMFEKSGFFKISLAYRSFNLRP